MKCECLNDIIAYGFAMLFEHIATALLLRQESDIIPATVAKLKDRDMSNEVPRNTFTARHQVSPTGQSVIGIGGCRRKLSADCLVESTAREGPNGPSRSVSSRCRSSSPGTLSGDRPCMPQKRRWSVSRSPVFR